MTFINPDGSIIDPFKNFIAISRYARWDDDKLRRETWVETVDRYIEWYREHLSTKYSYDASSPIFEEVREAILNHEVMPSMRALMTAGPALSRSHIAGYNCFTGDTKVITYEYGVTRLDEIHGETVTAWTSQGWRRAEAKYFGEQPTQRVTFRPFFDRSNHRISVDVTPDHRWILSDGTQTTSLKIGDRVSSNAVEAYPEADDYSDGVRHGVIFGDGSVNKRLSNGNYQHHVRLCGQHKDEMLEYFPSFSYPPSYNGDAVGYWTVPFNAKEFPAKDSSPAYIAGFIRGWLLADGNQINSDSAKLDSQHPGAYEWLIDNAAFGGYVLVGVHFNNKPTNFGERTSPLGRFTLKEAKEFVVDSISILEEQDVYCLVVPDTGDFTLANGLLTGNCSFIAVDHPRAFDEAMYILLNGTGVGFSVERRHVDKLPIVPEYSIVANTLVVEDSKEGWASAFQSLIAMLYDGVIPSWDLSLLRPAGARLKTFGGRASGPGPLDQLFRFTVDTFRAAAGRRLTPLEAHDIMCKVGDVIVSGGVRRSALISLSDLNDFDMAKAKSGNWWENNGHRALANNSATYMKKPSVPQFLREWRNLIESQSGERGIYNLEGARKHAEAGGRDGSLIDGTNPCGEILLRNMEFCNLTEVVIKPEDTVKSMARKVRLASILGTWQSTLTDFPYLREEWQKNCEEERLLGVSLTGIYGNKLFNNAHDVRLPARLEALRKEAHVANHKEARALGISASAAVTTVKPSGTVSQLTGVSSGIHPWHSDYYIRTVRGANTDPLTQMLRDSGVPNEPDVMKPDTTTVFSFPVKAPKGAITRNEVSAIDHLSLWAVYREFWTDHNPSVTINVAEDEWLAVGSWVYENWERIGGVSFLPKSEHTYRQAPYTDCSEEEYLEALAKMPSEIHWSSLSLYELMDSTTSSGSLACTSGECEVVDIGA